MPSTITLIEAAPRMAGVMSAAGWEIEFIDLDL